MSIVQVQHAVIEFLKSLNSDISVDIPQFNTINLFDNGLLDSLGIFQLIALIESQFDISIKPNDLILENFKTITTISEMIIKKQSINLNAK